MNDETSGVTAVVLAGGRGKRVGQNKALLKIGDVYLLEIVLKISGQSLTTYCLSSLRLTTITLCLFTFLFILLLYGRHRRSHLQPGPPSWPHPGHDEVRQRMDISFRLRHAIC